MYDIVLLTNRTELRVNRKERTTPKEAFNANEHTHAHTREEEKYKCKLTDTRILPLMPSFKLFSNVQFFFLFLSSVHFLGAPKAIVEKGKHHFEYPINYERIRKV